MPEPIIDYTAVLLDHGLRPHAATDEEKSMAIEIITLRRLLAHGDAAHDIKTLRNVWDQKNRVVAEAIAWYRDPATCCDGRGGLFSAVRELLRITGGVPHA